VGAHRPCRAPRQFHIVDDGGVVCVADEQAERFDDAAAGFVNGATLRVATAYTLVDLFVLTKLLMAR